MVRQRWLSPEKEDKSEIVKCKITGNSSYNLASAAVIARQYWVLGKINSHY